MGMRDRASLRIFSDNLISVFTLPVSAVTVNFAACGLYTADHYILIRHSPSPSPSLMTAMCFRRCMRCQRVRALELASCCAWPRIEALSSDPLFRVSIQTNERTGSSENCVFSLFFYMVKKSEGPLQHCQQICVSYYYDAYTTRMGHRFRLVLRGQISRNTQAQMICTFGNLLIFFLSINFSFVCKTWRNDRFVPLSLLVFIKWGGTPRK
jgi:hypothetical protein